MTIDVSREAIATILALTRLVALLGLVDDVHAAFATHELVVAVTVADRLQRIANFHRTVLHPTYMEYAGKKIIKPSRRRICSYQEVLLISGMVPNCLARFRQSRFSAVSNNLRFSLPDDARSGVFRPFRGLLGCYKRAKSPVNVLLASDRRRLHQGGSASPAICNVP